MPNNNRVGDVNCAICMDTLFNKRDDLDDLMAIATPDCGHVFHEACLHAWFKAQTTTYMATVLNANPLDSISLNDVPIECPSCRSEVFGDPETGEPIIHRLFINFEDNEAESSSQPASSPAKLDIQVLGLARRAKEITAEVEGVNSNMREEEALGIVSRGETLKEDIVSTKAMNAIKTYVGGLIKALNKLRVSLEDNPLPATFHDQITRHEAAVEEHRREIQAMREAMPAAVNNAVMAEQARSERKIRKVREECELIRRELEREQVARKAGKREREETERESRRKMTELQETLAREQADKAALNTTLLERTKLLKVYQAKAESRKGLKAEVEELRAENALLAQRRASPSRQPLTPRGHSNGSDDDPHPDSIQEIPASVFRASQKSHNYDESLQIDMPSFSGRPAAPKASAHQHPTARTFSFELSPLKQRSEKSSKYFNDEGKGKAKESREILYIGSEDEESPPKRSRTNPYASSKAESDQRKDLGKLKERSAGEGLVDRLGIADRNGRLKKGVATGAKRRMPPAITAKVKWSPALILNLLQFIASSNIFRRVVFPSKHDIDCLVLHKWQAERDVCLTYPPLKDHPWMQGMADRGFIIKADGNWVPASWNSRTTNPIGTKLRQLQSRFDRDHCSAPERQRQARITPPIDPGVEPRTENINGYGAERACHPDAMSAEIRGRLLDDYPYYTLLYELLNPSRMIPCQISESMVVVGRSYPTVTEVKPSSIANLEENSKEELGDLPLAPSISFGSHDSKPDKKDPKDAARHDDFEDPEDEVGLHSEYDAIPSPTSLACASSMPPHHDLTESDDRGADSQVICPINDFNGGGGLLSSEDTEVNDPQRGTISSSSTERSCGRSIGTPKQPVAADVGFPPVNASSQHHSTSHSVTVCSTRDPLRPTSLDKGYHARTPFPSDTSSPFPSNLSPSPFSFPPRRTWTHLRPILPSRFSTSYAPNCETVIPQTSNTTRRGVTFDMPANHTASRRRSRSPARSSSLHPHPRTFATPPVHNMTRLFGLLEAARSPDFTGPLSGHLKQNESRALESLERDGELPCLLWKRLLQLIVADPTYRQSLFPTRHEITTSKLWIVHQEVYLSFTLFESELFDHDALDEVGIEWKEGVDNPVSVCLATLKEKFERGEFGVDSNIRPEDFPFEARTRTAVEFPFYPVLYHLLNPLPPRLQSTGTSHTAAIDHPSEAAPPEPPCPA
ncbi:TRAF-interacting protein, partial [Tremellales sp. Uapishka_1]